MAQSSALPTAALIEADENYLRESILDSTAARCRRLCPDHASFRGQISEEQLMELIAYIKKPP